MLSEVALTKAEQMKLATKRSLTQNHISQASGSGADEGTGIILGVPDVPTYESDDEEISWKSSEDDDDDDVKLSEHDEDVDDQSDDDSQDDQEDDDDEEDDQTDSDNNGDEFVHPKVSTHDEEDKDEESFNPIVRTPSQVENSDDEGNDDYGHGMNVQGDEGPDAKDDDNELYGDLNINLEGRDIQMADVHTTQVIKDTHVTLTSVNPNGQQQSSFVSSHFVLDMLNPRPDTCFEMKLKLKMKIFFNKLDENIQKIIKEQVKEQVKVQVSKIIPNFEKFVNEQLEAEVQTRASNSSKTSYAIAADLSELEIKKILIEKMERNKSIHRSDEQKNLYKALVNAYECDKIILDTYRDTVTLKGRRDNEDKDEEPSVGSNRGSKRRRAGKEPESTSALKEKTSKTSGKSTEGSKSHHKTASESAPVEEPMHTT
nr:hypothetical protein [Tanacetum cinerariifolium]